jgi:asparagine synthase (glutamine-hydrolysing)
VALSGDGGDELFGGYTRYLRSAALWRTIEATPRLIRNLAACGVRSLSPHSWSALSCILPEQRRPMQFGDKMHKLAGVLNGEPEASAFYRHIVSLWVDPESLVFGGAEPSGLHQEASIREAVPDFVERMQFLDTLTYLPDDILTKVDRATMAVALEARVPLLDHRVVAFSWSLPSTMKTRDGLGKRLLRRVLDRYVPRELVERPKMGFVMPVHSWLRHELREWAEGLLDQRRLAREGLLDWRLIRAKWDEHVKGERNWQSQLWAVLMFQAWKDRWLA